MLIRDYDVSILQCSNCSAPRPAPDEGEPENCAYCDEAGASAREVGAFSRHIRVLVCDNCAAPMPVPISGGNVTCTYCQAVSQIVARREKRLGREEPVDEQARLEHLRGQKKTSADLLPAELHVLMESGGLGDRTVDQAHTMWQDARKELRRIEEMTYKLSVDPIPRIHRRLYWLTEMLADYYGVMQRHVVARSIVEASLEDLDDAIYVQPLYCWLARHSVRTGDEDSALEWLDLCDRSADNIGMDSAHRFAHAYISLYRGDLEGVLGAVGRSKEAFPTSGKYEEIFTVFRAHALEELEGVEVAVEVLMPESMFAQTWEMILAIIIANEDHVLCKRSARLVTERAWSWRWTIVITTVFVAGLLFIAADLALGPKLWGQRYLGGSAIALPIFWTLIMGTASVTKVGTRLGVHKKLHELQSRRSSEQSHNQPSPHSQAMDDRRQRSP